MVEKQYKVKCRYCNRPAEYVADWLSEGYIDWCIPLCERHRDAYVWNQQLHGWDIPTFTVLQDFIEKLKPLAEVGNEEAISLLKEWGVIQ